MGEGEGIEQIRRRICAAWKGNWGFEHMGWSLCGVLGRSRSFLGMGWFFLRVETGGASFIAWRHAGRAFWKRSGESGAFLLGSLPIRQGRDLVGVCLYISATCGFAFLAYLMKRRWRRRSEERF
jgi:hypothetical protein